MSKSDKKQGKVDQEAEVGKLKQESRDRDAELLASGKVKPGDLDRKNGFLSSIDFSKVKIVAVGDRKFEDID